MSLNHVAGLLTKIQDSKKQQELLKNTKKNEDVTAHKYPQWLEDIFYRFLGNYSMQWENNAPTEGSKALRRHDWFTALNKFLPETIMRASELVLIRCPSFPPKIGEMVLVCEDLTPQQRYPEYMLEHNPEFKRSEGMPEELKEKIRLLKLGGK